MKVLHVPPPKERKPRKPLLPPWLFRKGTIVHANGHYWQVKVYFEKYWAQLEYKDLPEDVADKAWKMGL